MPVLISANAYADPTNKQIEFAQKLMENPGILNAKWGTRLGLLVTVDLEALGQNPKLRAQVIADDIVNKGFIYTGKDICAIIYYGNGHKLAESCRFE
jgi:hypothetical protein